MWNQLLLSLGGAALGSVITHALHLKAAQIKGTAKVLHLPESTIEAADNAVEAGAQAVLQSVSSVAPATSQQQTDQAQGK